MFFLIPSTVTPTVSGTTTLENHETVQPAAVSMQGRIKANADFVRFAAYQEALPTMMAAVQSPGVITLLP